MILFGFNVDKAKYMQRLSQEFPTSDGYAIVFRVWNGVRTWGHCQKLHEINMMPDFTAAIDWNGNWFLQWRDVNYNFFSDVFREKRIVGLEYFFNHIYSTFHITYRQYLYFTCNVFHEQKKSKWNFICR